MSKEFIEKLNKNRAPVASVMQNEAIRGVMQIITSIYSDKAHMVYELLQNAEDAGATSVKFVLAHDRLTFVHNGKVFDEEDINSIASIADSSKTRDPAQIGKFGIGFKAVFAYTDTPLIYSGEWEFGIKDLIVPYCIQCKHERNKKHTRIVFPFNSSKKEPVAAYDELKKGLIDIDDATLLFLSNIRKIACSIDGFDFSIQKSETNGRLVEINNTQNENQSNWLCFKNQLPDKPKLFTAVAYKIGESGEIVPIDGKTCVYFCAEKEISALKFHIHAPFITTPSRDSLSDKDANKELLDLVSEGVAESLELLKEDGFLKLSFLETLPNKEDGLPSFYKPILDNIIRTFGEKHLLPTESGGFGAPKKTFKGSAPIKKLLGDEGLRFFRRKDDVMWLKGAPIGTRADRFLSSIKTQEFSDIDFCRALSAMGGDAIAEFFGDKSDDWYRLFYATLDDLSSVVAFSDCVDRRMQRFVLLNDNSVNTQMKKLFFENDLFEDANDFGFVKKSSYDGGEDLLGQKKARRFLEGIGVKEVGVHDITERMIKKLYMSPADILREEHLLHVEKIVNFYRAEPSRALECLRESSFVLCADNSFYKAENVYIDEPFETTKLKLLSKLSAGVLCVSELYLWLKSEVCEEFVFILKKLGAVNALKIKQIDLASGFQNRNDELIMLKTDFKNNETGTKIEKNWNIDFLKEICGAKDAELSLLLWNSVRTQICQEYFNAYYRPNQRFQKKEALSTLIFELKNSAWIPCRDGVFRKPCDMSIDMLANGFVCEDEDINGWLQATGFGAQKDKQPLLNIKEGIKAYAKEAEYIWRDMSPSIIKDHNKYVEIATKQLQEAIGGAVNSKEAVHFLQSQYKDHCQVCATSFAVCKNGECCKIFNWLSDEEGVIILKGGSLLLCPNCLAMLKKGSFNPLFLEGDSFIASLEEFKQMAVGDIAQDQIPNYYKGVESDMYKLPILLDGKERYIFYTEEHFLNFFVLYTLKT